MPPGPTAPRSPPGLLAVFRPCFTAPTFQTFIGLVVGLIAQTRRRTVCGMLTGAGLDCSASEFVNQIRFEIPSQGSACPSDLEAVDDVRFTGVWQEGAPAAVARRE